MGNRSPHCACRGRYEQQLPAFAASLRRDRERRAHIVERLVLVAAVFEFLNTGVSVVPEQLMVARDAVVEVRDLAQAGGFADVAAFYHAVYEEVCMCLARAVF